MTEINDIASALQEAYTRQTDSRDQWIASTLEIAALMALARGQHPNDHVFSIWLAENDCDFYGKNDRAAYIKLGQHPDATRLTLAETSSMSVELIARHELPGVLARMMNPVPNARNRNTSTPETSEIDAIAEDEVKTPAPESTTQKTTAPKPGKPTKAVAAMGEETGGAIDAFFPARGSRQRRMLVDMWGKGTGKAPKQITIFAAMLATGDYGSHNNANLNAEISARLVYPQLPKLWVRKKGHSWAKKNHVALGELIANMPHYKALVAAMEADNPMDADIFCGMWWSENVDRPPQATEPSHVTLITDNFGSAADEHYGPDSDQDIVMCGKVLHTAGSRDRDTYLKIYAAYQYWDLLDRTLTISTPDVTARGFIHRRQSVWLKVADPAFGHMVWLIGNEMALHSDRFEERSAAPKRGNYADH